MQSLEAGDNIIGVGLTTFDVEALAQGAPGSPGEPGLVVYTVEKVAHEQVLAEITQVAGTRALSEAPILQVRLLVLSNNHVLANSNSARLGDSPALIVGVKSARYLTAIPREVDGLPVVTQVIGEIVPR